jgi:DHA1 family multidrug resistance protein-like MFS transporter
MKRGTYHASGWRVVLVLFFLTSLVESAGMSHVFAFMPVYLQDLRIQHITEWVGILSSITFVTGLPLVPLWGIWAQRIGGKAVIMRSAYVEMVVFVVLALSHNLSGVFVAMMLVGFQLGNTGIMLAALRSAAPEHRIGFAVSVFSVSSSIGMAGGPLLGGVLTGFHVLNLHGLYILDGVLSFATGTMLWVFYRQPQTSAGFTGDGKPEHKGSAWNEAWKSVRFTFSLRITWVLFGVYTVLMMARQMVSPYLPIVIENLNLHFASPTFIIGVLMGLTALVGAGITVVAGRLGDRLGFVRILVTSFAVSIPAAIMLGLLNSRGR